MHLSHHHTTSSHPTSASAAPPHLVWIYNGSPAENLDAATWLDTTAELRAMGWHVTLIVIGPAGPHQFRGVELFGIPTSNTFLLRQLIFHLKVLRLLVARWHSTDIVLFHAMSALCLLPLRLARVLTGRRRPQFVMDTRTMSMPPLNQYRVRDRLRHSYLRMMERLANTWADGRLAITRRMAEVMAIPPHKLWGVWPSGVNAERLAVARTARRWPAPDEPVHLVYIGVLHYERNLMTLSKAVEQANRDGMAFRLLLVGDGAERADLEQFAATTDGRVQVMPPVPHAEIGQVLGTAHVGVLPFPDEEKFHVSSPIKLFEYMAAGLPVLATRIVCHTDVIGAGSYAIWAEQADRAGLLAALQQVWQQRAELSMLGARSAEAAQAWTWQESARKLKMALEDGMASERDVVCTQ
jgi:glycosyltransferase involved in cell wall biosynthesis